MRGFCKTGSMLLVLVTAWLVLGGLILAVPLEVRANEILLNGGFETGVLDPWYSTSYDYIFSPPTIAIDYINAGAVHRGHYSVGMFHDGGLRQDFLPVSTSLILEVSFWERRFDGIFSGVNFFYNDGTAESFTVNGVGSDWHYFNVTNMLDPGKSLVGLRLSGTSPGPAYFDDISIKVVPEPTTMLLFGTGLAGLAAVGRRRRN